MLEAIAIDTRLLSMALAMVGRILLDLISRKMALMCKDIEQLILDQVCIATTMFATNKFNNKRFIKMRKFLIFFLVLFYAHCYASDHTYDVSGEDENGQQVEETIYSNNGEREVSGELIDENGNNYDFSGQWDGAGHISGETDDGISVELDTN